VTSTYGGKVVVHERHVGFAHDAFQMWRQHGRRPALQSQARHEAHRSRLAASCAVPVQSNGCASTPRVAPFWRLFRLAMMLCRIRSMSALPNAVVPAVPIDLSRLRAPPLELPAGRWAPPSLAPLQTADPVARSVELLVQSRDSLLPQLSVCYLG